MRTWAHYPFSCCLPTALSSMVVPCNASRPESCTLLPPGTTSPSYQTLWKRRTWTGKECYMPLLGGHLLQLRSSSVESLVLQHPRGAL